MSEIYKVAKELAADLAEEELAANMGEMFIENSGEKAKKIRLLSENDADIFNPAVHEFRRAERTIYGAVYSLLEGFGDYKLIDITKVKSE
jgi:hypothetical protein